jgi:RNA recognition motif
MELFVSNLPSDTAPVELAMAFARFGDVTRVSVPAYDGAWGTPKTQSGGSERQQNGSVGGEWVAVVRFVRSGAVATAQQEMNGSLFGGQVIRCKAQKQSRGN